VARDLQSERPFHHSRFAARRRAVFSSSSYFNRPVGLHLSRLDLFPMLDAEFDPLFSLARAVTAGFRLVQPARFGLARPILDAEQVRVK
jgi:hypothetical protein